MGILRVDEERLETKARQAAEVLARALPTLVDGSGQANGNGHRNGDGDVFEGVGKPELGYLMAGELRRLLDDHPDLAASARRAGEEVNPNGAWSALRDDLALTLQTDREKLAVVWSLLVAAGVAGTDKGDAAPGPSAQSRRFSALLARVEKLGVAVLLGCAVLMPLSIANGNETVLLKWFAVVVMASLPGWLFLRFIVFRAGSLWNDYVLHLHRLGMDYHENLPEPPQSSAYYQMWYDAGGPALAGSDNIYQQKFEAYYGKAAGPGRGSSGELLRDRSVFTVLVATAIFAVGWAALLHDGSLLTTTAIDMKLPGDALKFGFLGAYSFSLQMLMRRFFQSDLKASAYIASSVRVITVLILVLVLAQANLLGANGQQRCAMAFLIGFFPLLGMQLLQKVVATGLKRWVPTLRNPYPLSELDGLNVWYEARMLEECIEDMQNLVTANIVDVLLHTRVPVGRLVDWIDQAHLYLLLDPVEDHTSSKRREHKDRLTLRGLGVRTATDLESAFTPSRVLARRAAAQAVRSSRADDLAFAGALRGVMTGTGEKAGPSPIDGMLRTFCNMPNLIHVRHWRDMHATEQT